MVFCCTIVSTFVYVLKFIIKLKTLSMIHIFKAMFTQKDTR